MIRRGRPEGHGSTGALKFLLVVAMLLSATSLLIGHPTTPPATYLSILYVPHSPVMADSDLELASLGWPGDGSPSNPYTLDGYEIDATGTAQGLFIGNTTLFFVISNCSITSASESGIHLLNVTNGVVRDTQCLSNIWYGIAVVNSASVVLVNNTCTYNHFGILLHNSDWGLVQDCVCTRNGDGLLVRQSENNTIRENECSYNDGGGPGYLADGIRLTDSVNNELILNECYLNFRYQIVLDYSSGNLVSECHVSDVAGTSSYDGMTLTNSNGNTIDSCTISWGYIRMSYCNSNVIEGAVVDRVMLSYSNHNRIANSTGFGIYLDYSHNNTASGNTCSGGLIGLSASHSDDNVIVNNVFTNNKGRYLSMGNRLSGYGISLTDSSRNNVSGNDCSGTMFNNAWGAFGIALEGVSADNIVSDNICDHDEGMGIFVVGTKNVIRGNSCNYSDGRGIRVDGPENIISFNVVYASGIGIDVDFSGDRCVIDNNTISYCDGQGIQILSEANLVTNNSCVSNLGEGLYFNSVTYNNVVMHNRFVDDGFFPYEDLGYLDQTNTVNGRPVYYLKHQSGMTIPSGAGQVILFDCDNIVVEGQNLSRADVGITAWYCSGCIFRNNNCSDEDTGISLRYSDMNTVSGNNISYNRGSGLYLNTGNSNSISGNGVFANVGYGMIIYGTSNEIWNNTFAWNRGAGHTYDASRTQAYNTGQNFWNVSGFGNYWIDWTIPDMDFDGIVDLPYALGGTGVDKDYFPRVSPTWMVPPEPPIPEFGPFEFALVMISMVLLVTVLRRTHPRS